MTSIIIPAHNEEAGISQLLTAVLEGGAASELEIVVVCNGCTDRTADVARAFGETVLVVELTRPSKASALKRGDQLARTFPRIYVDSDVEIDAQSLRELVATLDAPGIEATAPERTLVRTGVSRPARWYYDLWEQLHEFAKASSGAASSPCPRPASIVSVACPRSCRTTWRSRRRSAPTSDASRRPRTCGSDPRPRGDRSSSAGCA